MWCTNRLERKVSHQYQVYLLVFILFIYVLLQVATASILIWPTRLYIEQNEKNAALWLENKGNKEKVVQVRVFSWVQQDGDNQLVKQSTILASPPMARIAPGARQLIRIVNRSPIPSGKVIFSRVIVDEIPQAVQKDKTNLDEISQGIQFQLRYSIPLFLYGQGLSTKDELGRSAQEISKILSWKIISQDNALWLTIKNSGLYHVMLNEIEFSDQVQKEGAKKEVYSGYILPNSVMKWQIKTQPASQSQLHAIINGKEPIVIRQQ